MTIKDLPEEERPRERLQRWGEEALSTAELLAVILRTGAEGKSALDLAHELLAHFGGDLGRLFTAGFGELCQVRGIGPAKAAQLKACFELGKRAAALTPEVKPVVRSPRDIARLFSSEFKFLKQEHFACLLLDARNRVISKRTIFVGSLDASLVHPREVFREAIREAAAKVVLVHNHPSGDPTPSEEDIAITRQMVEAGKLVGIEVLDHVIIGGDDFVSMRERGFV